MERHRDGIKSLYLRSIDNILVGTDYIYGYDRIQCGNF